MGTANPANFWDLAKPAAQAHFRLQHHRAHATYDRVLGQFHGIALPTLDLTAPINRDWLHRHDSRHRALLTITAGRLANPQAGSAPTVDLSSLNLKDEQALRAWMHYHAYLHANLDQFLGVRT
jgi:hypothetical protein